MFRLKRAILFLSVAVAATALAGICFTSRAFAQANQGQNTYSLGATVLIDAQGTAYFSTPDGAITAVRLDSGAELWTTPKGKVYKPLAISGKLLVLQQELGESKQLGISFLQLADGIEQFAGKVELPAGAWASVKDGLGASLKIRVVAATNDKMTIAWASERRTDMRGMDADEEEKNDADGRTRLQQLKSDVESNGGALEIDRNGNVTVLDHPATALQFSLASQQEVQQYLPEEQRLRGLPDTQFTSTDGRHILVSELTGDQVSSPRSVHQDNKTEPPTQA